MKKHKNCGLCKTGCGFGEHIIMLAISHLMVEFYPKEEFEEEEIINKSCMLSANIMPGAVHKNLEYISRQLDDLGSAIIRRIDGLI